MDPELYRPLISPLVAAAPRPFERIEAALRLNETMFQGEFHTVLGNERRAFRLPTAGYEAVSTAARDLRDSFRQHQGVDPTRINLQWDSDGHFKAELLYEQQLLQRLAAQWARALGAESPRLRVTVTASADGRLSQQFQALNAQGQPVGELSRPRSDLSFDAPRQLLADLWLLMGKRWQQMELDIAADGSWQVRFDGKALAA